MIERLGSGILGICLLAACSVEESQSESTGSTTPETSTSTTTSGADSSSSSTGPGTGSSSTGPKGPSVCRRSCELPAQCCPAGQAGCPSLAYPFNFGCEDGVCTPPQCASDEECESVTPGTTCHPVGGIATCVQACDADPEVCTQRGAESMCVGQADDGASYCMTPCTSTAIDCGVSVCDEQSGLCVCEDDDQCPFSFSCA